ADCVKFGGGMGDIIRGGKTSGYPRYCEGSRYWLQYAGAKPELVYKLGFRSRGPEDPDYTEDYVCRAEYANYLKGAPYGPNKDRNFPGLKIPVDLYFSFHTDAGIKDGIVGTLTVYRVRDDDNLTTFPNGEDRLENNRMFADMLQSEIVNTARAKYTGSWTRRQLRDMDFSEDRRGNMPSCLLELLAHQNFHDMQYGLDPRFRFDISRAIYKAMLKFIAFKNGYEPVVQPLAPTHFRITRQSETSALLEWKAQPDLLEPSAMPEGYIVYKRTGEDESLSDFDEGVLTREPRFIAEKLDPDTVYSFRIAAYNAGGKSFPSEALCVKTGRGASEKKRCLIINAFDRLAPPSYIIKEGHSGFDRIDKGVGYMANYGLTGDMWDYDPKSKFRTNDAPGHGASSGDLETKLELGNTFDFSIRHGAALAKAGWGFDCASDEAVREGLVDLKTYPLVDWLLGEERTTEPPKGFNEEGAPDKMKTDFKALEQGDQELISEYLKQGGAIFLSGAYMATDLAGADTATAQDKKFLEETLKIYWTTNHGCKTNDVLPAPESSFNVLPEFHISSGIGEDGIYGVELPDSIKPAVAPKGVKDFETSETILRYRENGWSAATAMQKPRKVVVFGFPFECVVGAENRAKVMQAVTEYLAK
ncbi:fibronectin type III domain-containing protein, partial [Candidatus Sumerlaeota bacterium]|nr:fibronectin type III domain-containing protein [Candidatus Sumerlaeota bacterium]